MLVLSRKKGEEITIGEGVRISVIAVSGSRVKLAIDAPRDVEVARSGTARFEMIDGRLAAK